MPQHKQIQSNIESKVVERSTPLRPAFWMTAVITWATVIALLFRVADWAEIFLCVMTGLSFLSWLIPYTYLMIYDREALRRERFHVKGPSAKQLESVDTANEKLIADPGELVAIETQPLERKHATHVTGGDSA